MGCRGEDHGGGGAVFITSCQGCALSMGLVTADDPDLGRFRSPHCRVILSPSYIFFERGHSAQPRLEAWGVTSTSLRAECLRRLFEIIPRSVSLFRPLTSIL